MIFKDKDCLKFKIGLTLIDLTRIFLIEPSWFEISFSVISYDRNTAESCHNIYNTEERIVSKLSKILIPHFDRTNWRFE